MARTSELHRVRGATALASISWLFSCGLPIGGCIFESAISNELAGAVRISCEEDTDCPADWSCRRAVGLCAPGAEANGDAPRLLGQPSLSSSVLRLGSTTTLTFTVSELLLSPPVVSLVLPQRRASFTLVSAEGTTFVFAYTADGSEASGTHPLEVDLLDLEGISTVGLAAGNLRFDFAAPQIASARVTPARARAGQSVEIEVVFDSPLPTPPELQLSHESGARISVAPSPPNGAKVSFTYVPTGEEPEGRYVMELQACADEAGNVLEATPIGDVLLDFKAPQILSAVAAPLLARPGVIVAVTVELSEESSTLPRLVGSGSSSLPFALASVQGRTLVFTRAITSADEGEFSLTLLDLVDEAGNESAEIAAGAFMVDATPPSLLSFVHNATTLRPDEMLELELWADEPLQSAPEVRLGAHSLPWELEQDGEAYRLVSSLSSMPAEGVFPLTVELVDVAGNVTLGVEGSITVDGMPPNLLELTCTPTDARIGSYVLLSVSVDEPLAAPPELSWQPANPGFVLTARSDLQYTFTLLVDEQTLLGNYTIEEIALTDDAGNPQVLGPEQGLPPVDLSVDSTLPRILNLTTAPPSLGPTPGHDTLNVTFDVSEPLVGADSVKVQIGNRAAPCAAPSPTSPHIVCTYTLDGSETEGLLPLRVTTTDKNGNQDAQSSWVLVDKTAPAISPGTVSLRKLPGALNPLTSVDRVTDGTTVQLSFLLDDPEAEVLSVHTALHDETFARIARVGGLYTYERNFDGASDGERQVIARARDEAGNEAQVTISLPSPGLIIDRTPPSPPHTSTAELVVFERRPWGTSDTGGASTMTLRGEADAAPPGSVIIAGTTSDVLGSEVGREVARADGSFGPIILVPQDARQLFVLSVDEAGNASASTPVNEVVWTMSMGRKEVGSRFENPHRALAKRALVQRIRQPERAGSGVYEVGATSLAVADDVTTEILGAGTFRMQGLDYGPPGEFQHSLAYDTWHGRLVRFGGRSSGSAALWTMEPDWKLQVPVDAAGDGNPPLIAYPVLGFDEKRGVVVIFGGNDPLGGGGYSDTWEFDGSEWRLITPFDPEGDGNPGFTRLTRLVFMPNLGKLVMPFGETSTGRSEDVWAYDGFSWELLVPTDPEGDGNPKRRSQPAVTYDNARERLVLFGGNVEGNWVKQPTGPDLFLPGNDTWEWDGASWELVDDGTAGATRRVSATLAYDPERQVSVLFGGNTANSYASMTGEVWEWNGTLWTQVFPNVASPQDQPPLLNQPSMVFDPGIGEVVLHGGQRTDFTSEKGTWVYDGHRFARYEPLDPENDNDPPRLFDFSATAFKNGSVVVFGGRDNGNSGAYQDATWIYEGQSWRKLDVAVAPSPRTFATMAYDSSREVIVLFGGGGADGAGLMDTWELSESGGGYTWTNTHAGDPASRPPGVFRAAATYDPIRDCVFLFGGDTSSTRYKETWRYDASNATWSQIVPTDDEGDGNPLERSGHVFAFDPTLGESVLYGGNRWNGTAWEPRDDTWSFDGIRWRVIESEERPGGRIYATLGVDSRRNRLLLFAGQGRADDGAQERLSDLWSFAAGQWRPLDVVYPDGAAQVTAQSSSQGAFSPTLDRLVKLEGWGALGIRNATWLYDDGAESPPALSFEVATLGSGVDEGYLQWAVARVWAGATGEIDLAPVHGVDVSVWIGTQWSTLATSEASSDAPALVEVEVRDSEVLELIRTGQAVFTVAARGRNGRLAPAKLTVDGFELDVRYDAP
ncbi:MAG: Kelch repeat-containing protein [Myxococcota bacterium]